MINGTFQWSQPKIDVRIAFEPGAQLGREYNRILAGTSLKWVLFVDQDVLILNPHWYMICQEAIRRHPDAGVFTCFTNSCGCKFSRAPEAPPMEAPISAHRAYARKMWDKNGYSCTVLDVATIPDRINGFFMMTSKAAWEKVRGFRGTEMFGEDTAYHRKMIAHGIPCYRIDGIYVYHRHERIDGPWITGEKTSREYWLEFKRRRDEKNRLRRSHGKIRPPDPNPAQMAG